MNVKLKSDLIIELRCYIEWTTLNETKVNFDIISKLGRLTITKWSNMLIKKNYLLKI